MMINNTLTLGEGYFLVSVWKPVVLLIPFVGWLWVISRVYDKHAARFFLPRTTWNLIHLSVGLVAFIAALSIPLRNEGAFWAGLGVMVVILAADLFAYPFFANKDERVPEQHRVKLKFWEQMAEKRAEKAASKKIGKAELVIRAPDKSEVPVPERETPAFEVRVAAENIVVRGIDLRSQQIDLGPTGKDTNYGASYLVDGVRQAGEVMPAPAAAKIIDFWKAAGKLDVADRRRKQQADINIERGVDKLRVRLVTLGAQQGQRLSWVFDPERAVRKKIEELGLLEPQMAELRRIVEDGTGVVLLAAPPDMGRTTSFYSILRMHDAYTTNIQTLEMDPQDSLEGVRQNKFEGTGDGPDYGTLLRSILRRDPQIVGIAELPDEQTAKEVLRAELERVRLYISLKGDSALGAIQTFAKSVGDLGQAANALHGVVAQKLCRKLCINCRVPYQPTPDMLKKLGAPATVKQLYKKGGQVLIKNKPDVCPVCRGIGYVGQEGLFEVYFLGKPERDLIKAGNLAALRAELRKKQLPSLQQAALMKVVSGVTSVEELARVTAEQPAPAAPKPGAPAAKA